MLTVAEQTQIKRHLGYSSVLPSWYPLADVWLTVGQILSTLPSETETEARALLTRLTNLEANIDEAPERLKALAVGSIKLSGGGELASLWAEIRKWRVELSTLIGVPSRRTYGQIVVT